MEKTADYFCAVFVGAGPHAIAELAGLKGLPSGVITIDAPWWSVSSTSRYEPGPGNAYVVAVPTAQPFTG